MYHRGWEVTRRTITQWTRDRFSAFTVCSDSSKQRVEYVCMHVWVTMILSCLHFFPPLPLLPLAWHILSFLIIILIEGLTSTIRTPTLCISPVASFFSILRIRNQSSSTADVSKSFSVRWLARRRTKHGTTAVTHLYLCSRIITWIGERNRRRRI